MPPWTWRGERNVLPDLVGRLAGPEPRQPTRLAHSGLYANLPLGAAASTPQSGGATAPQPGTFAETPTAAVISRNSRRLIFLLIAHPSMSKLSLMGGRSLSRPQDESMYEQTLYVRSPTSGRSSLQALLSRSRPLRSLERWAGRRVGKVSSAGLLGAFPCALALTAATDSPDHLSARRGYRPRPRRCTRSGNHGQPGGGGPSDTGGCHRATTARARWQGERTPSPVPRRRQRSPNADATLKNDSHLR